MHRSGTSAVAGAAIRLGLAPPRTLLQPNEDNPAGFHESVPIAELNHLVLNALGRNWYHCLSFDPDLLDAAARDAAFASCTALLRQEFANEPAFVMKDPLLCLTLPIWLPALHGIGATVSALLVLRHPDEVARSIFRRDGLPETETAAVWLHHTLEGERMTRSMPRAMVFYTDLLHDWRGCMERAGRTATIAWPAPINFAQPDLGQVVRRSLRHHVAAGSGVTVGSPPVRELIDAAWPALRQLRDNAASPAAYAKLDHVRAQFAFLRDPSRG